MSTCTPLARLGPLGRSVVIVLSLIALAPAQANEPKPPADAPDAQVTLGDADLRMITLEVMKTHPLLASSPGVKHAEAYRGYQISNVEDDRRISSIVNASVIFLPHSETAGVRNALRAHCSREHAAADWACPIVELRRYVRLENQDFEVRVKGNLTLEAVLALVETTRATAASAWKDGSADTVSMLVPCDGGYLVSWTDRDHQSGVLVKARLAAEGNPEERDDWDASLYQEEWLAPIKGSVTARRGDAP